MPGLGDDLAEALLRGLVKAPDEHYPSARALAEARTTQALQATALADLLAQADAARESGEWLQMQQCCVQIMQLDSAHPGVMQMMAEATAQLQQQNQAAVQRRQMAEQYREAVEACDDARWEEAVAILERLSAADADFRDVRQRLDQARAELRCVQQYAQAIAHGEAGKWPAACRAWLEVLRLHPGDREGESLAQALDAMAALLDDVDVL